MSIRLTFLLVLLFSVLPAPFAAAPTAEERQQARLEQLANSLARKLQSTPVEDAQYAFFQRALTSLQRQRGVTPEQVDLHKGAGAGIVSGRILRSANGSAIAGATVTLRGANVLSMSSDNLGNFRFTEVPDGDYFLYASPPSGENLAGVVFGNRDCAGSSCSALASRGTRIQIDDNAREYSGIRLEMAPGATLTGVVIDSETGTVIPSATATVFDPEVGSMLSASADSRGIFDISGLPAQEVGLTVRSPDHTTTAVPNLPCMLDCNPAAGATLFSLTADQTLDVERVAALTGSFIEGEITRADTGGPVEGALILAWDEEWFNISGAAFSDAEGNYRMLAQPDYDHSVHVANNLLRADSIGMVDQLHADVPCLALSCYFAALRDRVHSSASGSVEVNMALQPEALVTGRVIDAATGEPIPGAGVSAVVRTLRNGASGLANEDGEFQIRGMPADTYHLSASASGYRQQYYPEFDCDGCDPRQAPTVTVGPGGVADIEFALTPGIAAALPQNRVEGTVVDEDLRSLDQVSVRFYLFGRGNARTSRTFFGGLYSRSGLTPGLYHVDTGAPSNIDQVYPGIDCLPVCDLAAGRRIHIVDGTQIKDLDFALNYGAGVRGAIRDRDTGTPLPYMSVNAYDADGNFVKDVFSSGPAGQYELTGLPPGDYQFATDAYYGRVNRSRNDIPCYGNDCAAGGGALTTLMAGEQLAEIDFNIEVGGGIEGIVTKPGGEPSGYDYTIAMTDGLWWSFGYTHVDGTYYMGGLPPGSYNVRTWDEQPGFTETAAPAVFCPNNLCDPAALTAFEVTLDGPPAIADIELLPGATLSGTVTEAFTGKPVERVTVSIRNAAGQAVDSQRTSASGFYLRTGLPPGEYFVQAAVGDIYLRGQLYPDVECLEEDCAKGAGQLITVTAETPVENIDFALLPQNLFPAGPGISASWYDSGHDGEGFLIEMLAGGQALIYWFTYDNNGNQRWFIGTGAVVGATIEVIDFLEVTGPAFGDGFDPAARTLSRVGNAFFEFNGCGAGVVDFVIDSEIGHQDIGRLTTLEGVPCAEDAKGASNVRSGSWYGGAARDGEGFLVQILGETALVVWFTYGLDGQQMWLIGVGEVSGDEIVIGELQVTSGGRFGEDFDPDEVNRENWGSLTLTLGCDTGAIAWEANDEAFGSGGYPVERLTRIDGTACTEAAED